MKLTQSLCKQHAHWWFKQKWAVQGNRRVMENPTLMSELTKKGIPVEDAVIAANPSPVLPIVPIPEPWTPPLVQDSNHPKWKPKICHRLTNRTKLLEGVTQGQILTKTVTYEGLPARIKDLVGVLDKPDQDELVRRAIFLSRVWDGWQEKLPRSIDLNRIGYITARTYGIPVPRSITTLVRNLVKVMESQAGVYEDALHRTHLADSRAIVNLLKDDDLIQFDMTAALMVSSRSPLEPFFTPEEVAATTTVALPEIFPMKCTIDIPQTNVYDVDNNYPITKLSAHPHVHTLYAAQREQPPNWTLLQALNRGLVTCFTFAAAQAKTFYGEDVKKLPRPISVQCVLSGQQNLSLFAYQLNTLDLDSNDSVRNQAWIDADLKLYDRCAEADGRVHFEGYNPEVYRKLLALHLNGLSAIKRSPLPEPSTTPRS